MMEFVECSKCGKVFIPAPQHIYRARHKWYCCWTCFNHRHEGVEKSHGNAKIVEVLTPDGTVVAEYCSTTNASALTGYDPWGIRSACRNNALYKGYIWRYKNG